MHSIAYFLLFLFHVLITCHDTSQSGAIYYRAALHTAKGTAKKFTFSAIIFPQHSFDSRNTTIVNVTTYKNRGDNNLSFQYDIQPQIARNVSLFFCQKHPHIQNFNLYIVNPQDTLIQQNYTLQDCIINEKSRHKYDGTNHNWYAIFDAKTSVVKNTKEKTPKEEN